MTWRCAALRSLHTIGPTPAGLSLAALGRRSFSFCRRVRLGRILIDAITIPASHLDRLGYCGAASACFQELENTAISAW
jgi:hypothetical protein